MNILSNESIYRDPKGPENVVIQGWRTQVSLNHGLGLEGNLDIH